MKNTLVNGKYTDQISINDRGFQFGDGVFRTFVFKHGKIPHFQQHYKKLKNDAKIKSKLSTKLHLSSNNSENSDNGVPIRANCDKCDFQSTDQFSLLLHKSTKHPTYILNSQPEAVTGPLH